MTLPPPTSHHQSESAEPETTIQTPLPRWMYQVFRVFAFGQTMGETSADFDAFWSWMTRANSHRPDDSDVEDVPPLRSRIREDTKEEAKAWLTERGFCDAHEATWWENQLMLIELEERAAKLCDKHPRQYTVLADSDEDDDEMSLEDYSDWSDSGDEYLVSPEYTDYESSGSDEDDWSDLDCEQLGEGEVIEPDVRGEGGEMMDSDDVQLDDEGSENTLSREVWSAR